MKWRIPAEKEDWAYVDDAGNVVDVLKYDNAKVTYTNQAGVPLGKEFNAARKAIETGSVPKGGPVQEKLAL